MDIYDPKHHTYLEFELSYGTIIWGCDYHKSPNLGEGQFRKKAIFVSRHEKEHNHEFVRKMFLNNEIKPF